MPPEKAYSDGGPISLMNAQTVALTSSSLTLAPPSVEMRIFPGAAAAGREAAGGRAAPDSEAPRDARAAESAAGLPAPFPERAARSAHAGSIAGN